MTARLVESEEERARALDLVVDQIVPGRAATLRPHTRKELVATAVLAVPLHEASLKVRAQGVGDEPEDVEAGDLGGTSCRCRTVAGDLEGDPAHVGTRAGGRRSSGGPAARLGRSVGSGPCHAPWSCSSPTPSAVGWWARSCPGSRPRGSPSSRWSTAPSTPRSPTEHYAEHVAKDFYPPLRDFVTVGPLVVADRRGRRGGRGVRALNGATDGRKAAPGTIRGDLSDCPTAQNLVHGSDSPESAEREIAIWFPQLAD